MRYRKKTVDMIDHETSPRPAWLSPRTLIIGASVSVLALSLAIATLPIGRATAEETPPARPAPSVEIAMPTTRTITEWDVFTGRFVAAEQVEIRARVSGYLNAVHFQDGQQVEAGDLLFTIDPRPFEAALAGARADLVAANAALDNARAEAERGNRLLERGALAQEAADQRTRTLREAEAAYASARARKDQAELNLEFTEVRSPITGIVSDDFVNEGNLIVGGAQGGTLLTRVVQQSPIEFEFTTSEADFIRYRRLSHSGTDIAVSGAAQPVSLKLMDEGEFVHDGELHFVDNRLDPSTGTMRARAVFTNDDAIFAPGMFGRLRLAASGEYQAILIPDAVVQTDQASKFVWVANSENIAERRPVELGPIIDGLRVVRSGLQARDRVISSGTQFVMAGVAVAPKSPSGSASAQASLD